MPDSRYVSAGSVIREHGKAYRLPPITEEYPLRDMNWGIVHVNTSLIEGYLAAKK
jgi:hypothetical protein